MSDTIEDKLEAPCPNCGKELRKISRKDGRLFMDVTPYIVYCINPQCNFEEDAEDYKKRFTSN